MTFETRRKCERTIVSLGYAGLTSFTLVEPEVAKLDMSVIHSVDDSAANRKLVASTTNLCHDMGILVVEEGVETAAERDTPVDLKCDLLQGYPFAKLGRAFPVPMW